jgi:signal transduction histidine kinase/CheY-like chemotaxis protein
MLAAPGRADEMPRILNRLKQGERIEHYETVRRTKEGRDIDVSLTISPIRDATGRIVGASKIARDITERKLHEKLLKEADRRKDEFLAILAHELRSPLAPISNCVQILGLSDDLSPNVAQVRGIMEQQVKHLVRLVDDLLEISRINRGKIELRREPVELAAVIRGAVETSRPLIDAAGHQLAISICPEAMTLEADPVRLTQVIANLLNNAAKYTEHGGQIWLMARREGDEAVISVRDTGLGIAADMLPQVFDMFAQVGGTLNRAQGGLGIGLTLVKNLVHLHGGRVEAHSEGVGKGSEFLIRLPVACVQQCPPIPASTAHPKTGLRTRRILIVDDAPAAAYTLAKLLQALGQSVHTKHDAASALEYLRVERPDVVISDIAMPSMDGYEFARRVRQEPEMSGIVLVALTGYGQESDRQLAKEAGYDHHLVKPVSLAALGELLSSLPVPVFQ